MNLKIGDLNQRWTIHKRTEGDLILTSAMGIAVVDTLNKIAVSGSSLKVIKEFGQPFVRLRQDVVDRLLDAEDQTKATVLPPLVIELSELGIRARAYDPSSFLASA